MLTQTEFEFTLPRGYIDRNGNLHKNGYMRLATAADEILPLSDPRVKQNPAYMTIILLARVIKLGSLPHVDTSIIENLFASDMTYLQDMYQRINETGEFTYQSVCPHCGQEASFPINFTRE